MKAPAGRLLVRLHPRATVTAAAALVAIGGAFITARLVAASGDEPQVQSVRVVTNDPGAVADLPALTGEPVAALPRKLGPARADVAAQRARIRRAAARRQASRLVVSEPAPAAPAPQVAPAPVLATQAPPVAPIPVPATQAPTPVPGPAPQPTPPRPGGFDDSG